MTIRVLIAIDFYERTPFRASLRTNRVSTFGKLGQP